MFSRREYRPSGRAGTGARLIRSSSSFFCARSRRRSSAAHLDWPIESAGATTAVRQRIILTAAVPSGLAPIFQRQSSSPRMDSPVTPDHYGGLWSVPISDLLTGNQILPRQSQIASGRLHTLATPTQPKSFNPLPQRWRVARAISDRVGTQIQVQR